MQILIAEDDFNILNGLKEIFENEGYKTICAKDGNDALSYYTKFNPDFVCLDIMMPGMNGYDVCKEIRKISSTVPVIFISAKSEEVDKVLGLELGADDYIVKPFGVREVVARIRAITRRYLNSKENKCFLDSFEMNELTIKPKELRAYTKNKEIDLSVRDIAILQLLYENKGKVVNKDILYDHAWDANMIPNSRTLDQHISQLRKKIEEDAKNPQLIKTVHGVGYRYA